jgi:hypothetical protein
MPRQSLKDQNRVGLYLNGSDSYVTLPSSYIPSSPFSVAFWYKPLRAVANDRIVDQSDAGPTNGFNFVHADATAKITFQIRNAGVTEASIIMRTVKLNEWNFIVGTFETNSTKAYTNGVQEGSTDTSCSMSVPTTGMYIGRRTASSSNFARGLITKFMVYDKVLNQAEINNLYGGLDPTKISKLAVYYKLEERSGTVIVDSSENVRTGTRNGSATANPTVWFTEPGIRTLLPTSKSAKSLNFSKKTTALVSIADTTSISPETTSQFTWSSWIYLFDCRENVLPRICEKGAQFFCLMGDQTNAKGNQLALEITNDDNTTTEYWGSTKLQPGRWYHVATTFDGLAGGVCQHYVNGEKDAMQTILGPFAQVKTTLGSTLNLGNNHSNTRNLSGRLSDFRMHNTILSQDEIRRIISHNDVVRGLVAKIDMNEGTGSSVTDSSGNGNTGTITAATWESITNSRSAI